MTAQFLPTSLQERLRPQHGATLPAPRDAGAHASSGGGLSDTVLARWEGSADGDNDARQFDDFGIAGHMRDRRREEL